MFRIHSFAPLFPFGRVDVAFAGVAPAPPAAAPCTTSSHSLGAAGYQV
jgi:hypothetical protein